MLDIATAINFTNATGLGDIYLVAGGVFLGGAALGVIRGFYRWLTSEARNRDLEEVIVRAIAKSREAQATSEREP